MPSSRSPAPQIRPRMQAAGKRPRTRVPPPSVYWLKAKPGEATSKRSLRCFKRWKQTTLPIKPSAMRTASVYRSLGTIDPKLTDTALAVEAKLSQADPLDHTSLTRRGEMEAEREQFLQARASWDKIPEIDPTKPDGYLETATLYWDYYLYGEAIRWIEEGRKRLANPICSPTKPARSAKMSATTHAPLPNMRAEPSCSPTPTPNAGCSTSRTGPTCAAPIETITDNLVSAQKPGPERHPLARGSSKRPESPRRHGPDSCAKPPREPTPPTF